MCEILEGITVGRFRSLVMSRQNEMTWPDMLFYVYSLIDQDNRFYYIPSYNLCGQPCISVYWISKISEKGYRPVLELCKPQEEKKRLATGDPEYLIILEFSWEDTIDPTALSLN